MSEWQPIETAPKDGTLILIGRAAAHLVSAYSGIAYWHNRHFRDPTESVTKTLWVEPTHWMPLPAPPEG